MPRKPMRSASSVRAGVRSSFHAVPYRNSGRAGCSLGIALFCHVGCGYSGIQEKKPLSDDAAMGGVDLSCLRLRRLDTSVVPTKILQAFRKALAQNTRPKACLTS